MKKIFLLLYSNLIFGFVFGQSKFNLICRDFTFQQEISTRGKNLRNIFEVTITRSGYPFKVLERDKMDKIFETLQEEKNLVKDLSNEWKKKLQMENVDYLVVGDINENIAMDNFDLLINFIKISGNDMTVKLPMIITLSRKQIADNELLKTIFVKEIKLFIKSYFISEKDENSLTVLPKFYDELKKRDSLISILQFDANKKTQTINNLNNSVRDLQVDNSRKNEEIKKLNKDVSDIKEYGDIALMNVYGLPYDAGGGITISSGLSKMMENILEKKENTIDIKLTDSSFIYTNLVIQQFPNFPFAYWAKAKILSAKNDKNWLIYALKAKEILEITTTISGHHINHEEVLALLKQAIK